ncbi:MAG: GNAT family N-acetyltransferase, partial [Planctomycetota bacterium]
DSEPDRIYKIAMATSEDGIFWSKYAQNPIIDDALGETECQALPTMIENDGIYHLYFCFRHASDFRTHPTRGYRLGYAWSDDLKVWHRDDRSVGIERTGEPSAWDGQMMCYPHVFEHGRRPFLLYNGNAFGRDGFGVAEGVRIERSLAIRFSSNHATEERLIQHLGDCSDDYSTPLHMRVDLPAYAKKLFEKSVTFEAWNGDRLIGLLAAYLPGNDEAAHAFVSNVSVIGTFRRRGIAGDLLLRLHDQVSQRGLTQIQLDVDAESRSAISLYERFGYRHVSEHENQIRMCKPLQVKQESS